MKCGNERIRTTAEEGRERKEKKGPVHGWMMRRRGGERWHDAWRVRGCRRPAGAEGGEESGFGPAPRENGGDCQGERQDGGEGLAIKRGRREKQSTEEERMERCDLTVREQEVEGGRGGGGGRRSQETTSSFDGAAVF